ncbi:MAG: COG4705 family protein [Bacteroidia bacterium]
MITAELKRMKDIFRQREMLNKVPKITLFFWIIKILATTVGETAADYLSETLHLGLTITSYIMGCILLIMLFIQLRGKEYIPGIYWAVVVLLSIVGTLISDNLVDNLGVSLATTSILFGVALAITFIWWYLSEHTLSVHNIATHKRELFYWAAILFTFSLGTSAGDLVSESSGLGYGYATLLFAGAIGLVLLAFKYAQLNSILSFWIAYILTRPLGASMGDLLSQATENGGLGWGTTITSIVFLLTILTLVIYVTIRNKKTKLAAI